MASFSPEAYGIGQDPAFTRAFQEYERCFRAYFAQDIANRNSLVCAWALANTYIAVKNGLLQLWHETGDSRLHAAAQLQPVQKHLDFARDGGVSAADDSKFDALERDFDRAREQFAQAVDARLLAIQGDLDGVRAELAIAERAFEARRELARNQAERRNHLGSQVSELLDRRRELAREEAYTKRSTERERMRLEEKANALMAEQETLAAGHGKGHDTAELLWVTEVRAVARGAAVAARKADRKAANEALKSDRAAEAASRRGARDDPEGMTT